MKFILEVDEDTQRFTATRKVEVSVDEDAGLSKILESVGYFLRASGFVFDGDIGVVSEDRDESHLEDTIRYSTAGALGAELEYAAGEVAESERE